MKRASERERESEKPVKQDDFELVTDRLILGQQNLAGKGLGRGSVEFSS
jgi:hypothetical protein